MQTAHNLNLKLETFTEKYILAPFVRTGFLNGVLHFGFGSIGIKLTDKVIQNCILEAAAYFKEPKNFKEVNDFLLFRGFAKPVIDETVTLLKTKFLLPYGIYDRNDRHSRSLLYYSLSGADVKFVQEKIASKRIAIVGCGGIGNVISVLLATAGIKEFVLVDNDQIEISNLNRQIMFTEKDCGSLKTSILSKSLKQRSSSIIVKEISEFITNSNVDVLDDVDFILVSGDQKNVLDLINKYAVKRSIPFMNVGYVEDIAVWGPLVIPGKTGYYECHKHIVNFDDITKEQIEFIKMINSGYQAPSTGSINMMASSFATMDILKFLGGFGTIHALNTRIGIWSHDLHIEKQNYNYNPSCEICGHLQKAV